MNNTTTYYCEYPKHTKVPIYPTKIKPPTLTNLYCARKKLKEKLRVTYKFSEVSLFSTGREALLAGLLGIGISPGDEVIVTSFNCTALFDAIITAKAVPIIVDTEKK